MSIYVKLFVKLYGLDDLLLATGGISRLEELVARPGQSRLTR